jgi:PAS domain S-box-containing protein
LRAGILVGVVTAAALLSVAPSFRWISIAVVVAAASVLGALSVRLARTAARQGLGPHDLSERVALEQRLRASEARWRSIIQSAVDGIVVIDAGGRIEAFNPGAERLFGYAEREILGENVNLLMPSPYREEHDGYISRYLATGRAKIIGTGREVMGLRRDGTTFPLHLSVGEITLAGERKFTGILHDLTLRVSIEQQLRERAAMASLGEMAAVIAHEVKNPLAGVRGAIQVFRGRLAADSADAPILDEIVARVDALDTLMKDLLLFARPPQPRAMPVDVGRLVSMTAELIRLNRHCGACTST